MKKRLLMLAAMGLLVLGISAASYAAAAMSYNLVVTIATSSLSFTGPATDGGTINLGLISPSSTLLSTNYGFTDTGFAPTIHYSLSVTAQAANGWSLYTGTAAVPNDQYRLRAMFTQWDRGKNGQPGTLVQAGDFANNDILTNAVQAATANVFAYDGEGNTLHDGQGVTAGSARDLFFLVETGAVTAGLAGSVSPFLNVTIATP